MADCLVGRRLFCHKTQVKNFVDWSTDFQGFCHWRSVGRWSPDDRLLFWRNIHHDTGHRSSDHQASIGRRSPDGLNPVPSAYEVNALSVELLELRNIDHLKMTAFYLSVLLNIEGIPRNACGASRDISIWYLMRMIASYVQSLSILNVGQRSRSRSRHQNK